MSAFPRKPHGLTRAESRVLLFLHDLHVAHSGRRVAVSSRRLAFACGLSRRTVQNALIQLNDLGWVQTLTGDSKHPNAHRVLRPVLVRQRRAARKSPGARKQGGAR